MLYSPFAVWDQEIYGKLVPPNDVTGFQMVAQGDRAYLSWTKVADLDVSTGGYYWLRYTSKTSGVTWSDATDITKSIPGATDTYFAPLMSGTYLLKALDSSGNESTNSVQIRSNVADILDLNVVYTSTQHPTFGSSTADKGINDSNTTGILYDSVNNVIQLSASSIGSGTHDAYYVTGTHEDDVISSGTHDENIASGTHDSFGTGTHDDVRSTGTHNAILNAGSTELENNNFLDTSSGNWDSRSGSFDDILHTTNKLDDDNASFDASWLNNIIRNTTDNTTATVTSVDSSTVLTLSSDLFDSISGDAYRLETKADQVRDTSASFTAADVGRTIRNNTDGGTATISTVDSSNLITISSALFQNDHGDTWEIEAGPNVLRDTGASFTSALVGRTVRNTNDSTTATVSSFTSSTELVLSSGIFDNKNTHSYDIEAGSSNLYDSTGSFTSSMVGNIVKNTTRSTQATVSSYTSANEVVLSSGIFDNKEGDSYTINNELSRLRDTGASFTSALVGRTVRNTNDATTATVSAFVDVNNITLSSGIFDDKDGHTYEMEPGYDRLYDPSASFTDELIGKVVRNTTDNTTATVSSRVDGTELVLSSGIFDNQDGEGYKVEVPNSVLRDTGGSFDSSVLYKILRNTVTGVTANIVSVDDSNNLTLDANIFGQTDGTNYIIDGDLASVGYYYFDDQSIDLGQVYTSRLTANFASTSFTTQDLFDFESGNFDVRSGLFDGTDISDTNSILQVRSTADDPSGTPTWGNWTNFFIGDYVARGFEFRVKLSSSNPTHNVKVSSLSTTIDMPDTIKRQAGIQSDSGTNNGTKVVTYTVPFKTAPTVGITMMNANNKIYHNITSSTALGFTITFYDNNTSQASQQTFNWLSSGY
jgi:hypothetical protein